MEILVILVQQETPNMAYFTGYGCKRASGRGENNVVNLTLRLGRKVRYK